ncbi:MAG: hypothetical protein ACMXYC_00905, partial [Candidatus Woesearchaeota archaeon]
MSQRGQVTLFIILGIVLLFAVGLFFLFRSQIEEVDVRAKVYANPTSSLEAYVAQCMEDVTYEGLLLLGQQGGYIDLPPHIRFNPSLSIGSVPGSPLRTPLWGVEQTMPSMQEMEQELARFIQDDIMFCLQRMPIQVISEPEVRVEINQEDIMVFMDYHFEEIVDDVVLTSQHFVIVVPFSLPFIIETAEQLVRSLRQEKLLEIVTFDLMAGDEPYGNNHGVPLTGIRFSCQRPVWLERNVQMRIQEVLEANIPRIRVQNTNYVPFLRRERDYLPFATLSMQDFEEGRVPSNMPVDQYEFNHLFLDTGFSSEVARRGINVGFDYSSFYGMEFTVRPSRGGVMQGSLQEGGNQFLEFFCMYVYHFTYDLRFPIQASFIQEDAFLDGTPFVFN